MLKYSNSKQSWPIRTKCNSISFRPWTTFSTMLLPSIGLSALVLHNKFCHCRNRRRAPWHKHSLYNHKTSIFQFSKFFEDRQTNPQTDKVTYKDDYPSSKNIGSKHWKLPKMHFKTNFFLQFWGGWRSFHHNWPPHASNVSCEAIWQLFADPYHTESISWHVDHF